LFHHQHIIMSDCAVLSTNGEVRYHEASNTSTTSGEAQSAFSSSTNPSTQTNPTESERGNGESTVPPSEPPPPPPPSGNTASTGQQSMSEDYSAALEVPLRRSKRGKGRGAINASGQNSNNGVSSDDRVSSCIVEGIEYKTGKSERRTADQILITN
uniref:Fruitless n=1 Tax=Echinostoma caproni TaxID=27848 RepID=A0A183A300_9TREM